MVLMSIFRERQFQPETEIYALNKKGEFCIFELKCSIAAEKYVSINTNLLFIAEAPPSALERYFYFEDVQTGDSLWIELMKALYSSEFGVTAEKRSKKKDWLTKFKNDGYRLIDALKEPVCRSMSGQKRKILITAVRMKLLRKLTEFTEAGFANQGNCFRCVTSNLTKCWYSSSVWKVTLSWIRAAEKVSRRF